MRIDRVSYEPGAALDFHEEGLTALGALCERTWHDRLEFVAEGRAARLWNDDGGLRSGELHFVASDASGAREAAKEIFPGCPFTFRLAEALRPSPLPLDRLVLAGEPHAPPPNAVVAEKLWRGQFPDTGRWRLASVFQAGWHFSLVALVRCEIQAIDQHWSLRRLAVSLPDGELDERLAQEISFARADATPTGEIAWPKTDPAGWSQLIARGLETDLEADLRGIRQRQENSLRRELDRIDNFFENYAKELAARGARQTPENAKLKSADRLAAAKAEHLRRRSDQLHRHEIRVIPHCDGLLCVAEPAWRAHLEFERAHLRHLAEGVLVTRARRWEISGNLSTST